VKQELLLPDTNHLTCHVCKYNPFLKIWSHTIHKQIIPFKVHNKSRVEISELCDK